MASFSFSFSFSVSMCVCLCQRVGQCEFWWHAKGIRMQSSKSDATPNCRHLISQPRTRSSDKPKRLMRLVVNCSHESEPEPQLRNELVSKEDKGAEISSVAGAGTGKIDVGWKRTKKIVLERPKGAVIADVLSKFEGLMEHGRFGSMGNVVSVGGIILDRVKAEADILRAKGEVEEYKMTELLRVVRLLEVDIQFASSAHKEETIEERAKNIQMRCRQAVLIANAL